MGINPILFFLGDKMINSDFKIGNEILLENPCGKGCTSLVILQNWRDILTVEERSTSGSRASDVWSEPVIYKITVKQIKEMLEDEKIDPYGWDITILN